LKDAKEPVKYEDFYLEEMETEENWGKYEESLFLCPFISLWLVRCRSFLSRY